MQITVKNNNRKQLLPNCKCSIFLLHTVIPGASVLAEAVLPIQ